MQKNVTGQKLIVFAFDSTTNLPKSGDAANLTAYVSKDYGSVTVLADTSATEMSSSNAAGYYLFDLAQAETNADTLLFSGKSTTANIVVIAVPATVFTTAPNFNVTAITSSGIVSADVQTIKTQTVTLTATLDLDDLAADVDATETRVVLALPAAAPQAAGGLITSTAGSLDLDELNADVEAIQAKTDNLPASFPSNFDSLAITAAGGVTLADGVAHGGTPGSSTATIAYSRMVGMSQSANTPAVSNTGNGTAPGVKNVGGATDGDGMQNVGGGVDGNGLVNLGAGTSGFAAAAGENAGMFNAGGDDGGFGVMNAGSPVVGPAKSYGVFSFGSGGGAGTWSLGGSDDGDGAKYQAQGTGHDISLAGSGDILGNLAGTVAGLTAAGLATLFTVDSTKVYADAVAGSPVFEIASNAATDVSALALEATAQAIKTQTDLLPSDPADESLIIAATDALAALIGTPAGASLAADIAEVEAETDDIAAVKAKTDILPSGFPSNFPSLAIDNTGHVKTQQGVRKNTALANFGFVMVDSTDTPVAGLTVTATRKIDGGAFAACANAASGVANGWYVISLAAADLNGDCIELRLTAPGAVDRNLTIITTP